MIRKILLGSAIAVGVGILAAGGWFIAVTQDLPSAKELANYEPPITSRVHAGDGHLVAEFANQHRVYVPSEELPQRLIEAFISAEDKTFFEHSGVNLWGMFRGVVLNPLMGRKQTGGSTITQQTVKNMLVGNDRSAARKVREAILAGRLEKQFSKHQILELYMNEIYLGGRSYGVGAAALNYFGKSLGELTLAESALLAALPQQPSRVNPYNHPEAAVERRNWVIDRMVANGYVEKADAEKAKAEPLTTVSRLDTDENEASAYFVEEVRREILRLGKDKKLDGFGNEKEATKGFYEGGLSIRSTLDTNLQLAAQTALRAGLETYDHRRGWRGPIGTVKAGDDFETVLAEFIKSDDGKKAVAGAGNTWQAAVVRSAKDGVKLGLADGTQGTLAEADVKWASAFKRKEGGGSGLAAGDVILVAREATPDVSSQLITDYAAPKKGGGSTWRLRQIPLVEGAVVAMNPHTGRVLAMAGGYSFRMSQYNRAVQAMRQPGSSFKPFVYSAAMDNGWTPSSRVLDAPFVDCSDTTQEKCYKPANYTNIFYGLSTLRFGIEQSRNAMTVRLAQDMGLEKVSEIGERFGIYDKLPAYQSMSLGAGETTPLRMVTAYAMLVNGGKRVHPILLDRIQNRYGQTVFKQDERACEGCKAEWSNGLQPPAFADAREQVIDPVTAYQMVSILEGVVERGTAKTVRTVGKPIGAKTGTTNDQVDAWTMGFSPDLVVGVWVGFDKPKNMGEGESGGRVTAPIFRDFMLAALKDAPALPFRIPQGVRLVEVDLDSGCLPAPDSRVVILEAFKPGSEPTDRCVAGGEGEGRHVDYSNVVAGDEAVSAPVDGSNTPALPLPSGDLGAQIDPGQQQPQQPPGEELTLKDGIF
jgi:penicillin-binding protein 1A